MKINPLLFDILAVGLFMGVIAGFQAAGVWSVSGKFTNDGRAIQPLASDVNTIKGWMTLEQIASVYQVPLDELLAGVGLPVDTPGSTAVKDLESDTFETDFLKIFLENRMAGAQPNAEEAGDKTSAPVTSAPAEEADSATPFPTEHAAPERMVTGNTTFQDVYDWGVSAEKIALIVGSEPPSPMTLIREFAVDHGLSFSEIKASIQGEIDQQ